LASDNLTDIKDKYFSIPNLAGICKLTDGTNRPLNNIIRHRDFYLEFGYEMNFVFRSTYLDPRERLLIWS